MNIFVLAARQITASFSIKARDLLADSSSFPHSNFQTTLTDKSFSLWQDIDKVAHVRGVLCLDA